MRLPLPLATARTFVELSYAVSGDAWDFEARDPTRTLGALVTLMPVIFDAGTLMGIFAAVALMGIFSPGTPSRP